MWTLKKPDLKQKYIYLIPFTQKLQQMQTNVWGQKADEWLAAAEEGCGDEYQGPHVHYLVCSDGFVVIYSSSTFTNCAVTYG